MISIEPQLLLAGSGGRDPGYTAYVMLCRLNRSHFSDDICINRLRIVKQHICLDSSFADSERVALIFLRNVNWLIKVYFYCFSEWSMLHVYKGTIVSAHWTVAMTFACDNQNNESSGIPCDTKIFKMHKFNIINDSIHVDSFMIKYWVPAVLHIILCWK